MIELLSYTYTLIFIHCIFTNNLDCFVTGALLRELPPVKDHPRPPHKIPGYMMPGKFLNKHPWKMKVYKHVVVNFLMYIYGSWPLIVHLYFQIIICILKRYPYMLVASSTYSTRCLPPPFVCLHVYSVGTEFMSCSLIKRKHDIFI